MKYLIDANVWFQAVLGMEWAEDVVRLLDEAPEGILATTDFAIHSMGVRIAAARPDQFRSFLDDLIKRRVNTLHLAASDMYHVLEVMRREHLSFDDAFQYFASQRYDLKIVSFDADFDRTARGRLTPMQALAEISNPSPP